MSESVDIDAVLSGHSGVLGRRARLRARVEDLLDAGARVFHAGSRQLSRTASAGPVRNVLVCGIYGAGSESTMSAAVQELTSSKHTLTIALASMGSVASSLVNFTTAEGMGEGGKFENLNALLHGRDVEQFDWVLVLDDDVELPSRFLDRFVYCAEALDFDLAQPALTRASHAAWDLFRRKRGSIARQTRMVEIGPLTAFARPAAKELLPFPDLQMGWGLDAYWGGLALERGWRLGVVDAVAVRHERRPTGASYDRGRARQEAERFLASRPYVKRPQSLEVVEDYRKLPIRRLFDASSG